MNFTIWRHWVLVGEVGFIGSREKENGYRVSAAFVGRFRFSHLRLRNQTEEREVKVFRCGVALSSAYYLIFLKISFLVSYLHQFLPAIIVASFIAL